MHKTTVDVIEDGQNYLKKAKKSSESIKSCFGQSICGISNFYLCVYAKTFEIDEIQMRFL